ncbi:MAG: hypothetical protein D6816_11265 [Bacteroidetes bacterium]|nr:MAG: hypothetical protein D6816_11265 [Bacteroidota bacterium]
MGQYRNILTYQLDRYLAFAGHYHPLWNKWRSIYAASIIYLLFAWGASVIVFFFVMPLFNAVSISSYAPFIQVALLAFPVFIIVIFVLSLVLVRHITILRRHTMSLREFQAMINTPDVDDNVVLSVRKSLAECYCTKPDQITPGDDAKSLSRYGFVLHPTIEEFMQVLADTLRNSDPSLAYAIETRERIGPFQNVREIVTCIGSLADSRVRNGVGYERHELKP